MSDFRVENRFIRLVYDSFVDTAKAMQKSDQLNRTNTASAFIAANQGRQNQFVQRAQDRANAMSNEAQEAVADSSSDLAT